MWKKEGKSFPKSRCGHDARGAETGPRAEFITRCPECGAELVRYEGEAAWYCPNDTACPPQIKGRIEHYISAVP